MTRRTGRRRLLAWTGPAAGAGPLLTTATAEAAGSGPGTRARAKPWWAAGLAVLGLVGVLCAGRRMLLMAAPSCFAGHWHGCYDTDNGVVLMTLAGLPPAVLVACALAAVRGCRRDAFAEVGLVYGTVPMLWLTMMPGPGAGVVPGRVSLIPLADLVTMGPLGVAGNLVVLAALGFFAPIRFAAVASAPRLLALGAAASVLIETSQYVLRLDRVSSVDDVLVNAVGATLFGLASRRWWKPRGGTVADGGSLAGSAAARGGITVGGGAAADGGAATGGGSTSAHRLP
ncbi:VanZ family protein [Paractinoplanes brasiliensis]|uniref:VanZ like protein n=1 Tax=Paractinoplanes brasiliensis TaxID=52695 RepID=A0A4V3C8S8_9ACTN|nr:VanZ family protein [Actinoplanes brasiliensis]TDO42338.1 VanZ like protein [Actinoplanes brasiliensis]GID29570.1 hypothetical protein Abr02nite_45530 [Actinoplanes brasiliensis]